MEIYFVVSDKSSYETQAIREVQPDRVLCSYFYFRTKTLSSYCEKIGYKPKIMLDSGAYSAWTTGKNVSIIDYMAYIRANEEFIERYISLDVFGDPELTWDYYCIMRKKGFTSTPVYHYKSSEEYLQRYIQDGNELIALGGTVPEVDKEKVAKWVRYLTFKYPGTKFHLLGSNSMKITLYTDLCSCDSSTWFMMAVNGSPKHILGRSPAKKIERAKWNLRDMQERIKYQQMRLGGK